MNEIYLAGISMLTPLGADTEMVSLAVDAGVSAYRSCDVLGEETTLQCALVPEEAFAVRLPPKLPGLSVPQIRILQLAAATLEDLRSQLPSQPLPLFLAGPEPYYQPSGFNGVLIQHLMEASRVPFDRRSSRYFAMGRAGGIEAMLMAFRYFEATDAHYCLIGGVDTFHDRRTLSILDKQQRLVGRGPEGFVPGEGAAFALLASPRAPEAVRAKSLARLHVPGVTREQGHLLSNAPYSAQALAGAVKTALSNVSGDVDNLYTSQNGETHYVRELTIATLRHNRRLKPGYKTFRPAEFLGDLGAAFAPVALGLASYSSELSRTNSLTLICASSDGGPRAAFCVS